MSPADVRDWLRLGADFGQDALSGRPEVVGSGHAVGGTVSAAPSATNSTSDTAIQLQRMVSRCACQFVYVTYAPLVPTSLPPGQFVPPLVSVSYCEIETRCKDLSFGFAVYTRM